MEFHIIYSLMFQDASVTHSSYTSKLILDNYCIVLIQPLTFTLLQVTQLPFPLIRNLLHDGKWNITTCIKISKSLL